jgi:hypothetical protein
MCLVSHPTWILDIWINPAADGHFRVWLVQVVRLNKKYYDEQKFKELGIHHIDLYYLDGSIPTNRILQAFLEVSGSGVRISSRTRRLVMVMVMVVIMSPTSTSITRRRR